jgi:hypothetical protein
LIFASAALLLALMVTIVRFEPFAPRYQGQTVNQWLDFYVEYSGHADKEVIDGFGTNALSALIAANKPPFWLKPTSFFASRFRTIPVKRAQRKALSKIAIARFWGSELGKGNPSMDINLLREHPNDIFVLNVLDLCFDKRAFRNSRLEFYLWHADPIVRSRARQLWKLKYHWDDQTYQKWLVQLDEQNNRFSVEQLILLNSTQKPAANTNRGSSLAFPNFN